MKVVSVEARAALLLCAGVLCMSAAGYQGAKTDSAGGEIRSAYSKAIDWDSTLKFEVADGYDSNLGGLRTGTYFLNSDIVVGRYVIDVTGGVRPVLELGEGRTLTILGKNTKKYYDELHALSATGSGSGSVTQLKSGTILLPATYDTADTAAFGVLAIPRGPTGGNVAKDVTFLVGGGESPAVLDAQEIRIRYGTNNWVVVTNNGLVKVSSSGTKLFDDDLYDRNSSIYPSYTNAIHAALRNGIRVTDGGVYSNSTPSAGTKLELFGYPESSGNSFEVVNGGCLAGWRSFYLEASSGNTFAFRGSATRQIFDANTPCQVQGYGSRLEITDGAQLTLKDSEKNSSGRLWFGTGGCSNVVLVAGAGSVFTCESSGTLLGQKNTEGNVLEVRDGATFNVNGLQIGREGTATTPAKGNVLRVVDEGVYKDDSGSLIVGYGDDKKAGCEYSCSNRLEVATGGSVSIKQYLYICYGSNSWDNVVDVSDGDVDVKGTVRFCFNGRSGFMSVRDGGKVSVGNAFQYGQEPGTIASNCVMEVLSGSEVAVHSEFIVSGQNNRLVVSNGTICTASTTARGIQLTSGRTAGRDKDFSLVIAGTNPVIRAGSELSGAEPALSIRGDAVVDFIVPDGGYIEAPLQAPVGKLGIMKDTSGNVPALRFHVEDCGRDHIRCVIAEGESLAIDQDVLAAARAALPSNCRLSVTGNQMTLRVNPYGSRIVVR